MAKIYKIEKPNISNIEIKRIAKIFLEKPQDFTQLIQHTLEPQYLFWDKVKFKNKPSGLSSEEFWWLVKTARKSMLTMSKNTPIMSEEGSIFTWIQLPGFEKLFHEIDLNTGGNLLSLSKDMDDNNKTRFVSRGIMEEAIASSQLEGAHTTRKLAKEFLRQGRKPRTHAERMILNNYRTMLAIEEIYKNQKLNMEMLFELHAGIAHKTISEKDLFRLRTDKDEIVVVGLDDIIYHIPPKESFLNQELQKLISFANDELETPFIHPVIKAIMIHFWVGYLHPFVDGNGRLARLLFYWYLLKKDYWAFAYLPISLVIKRSPVQYQKAFIYSEQDDNDLTYFIDYNIRKIKLAVEDFKNYLESKFKSNFKEDKLSKFNLNERQLQLLQYYHKEPGSWTTPTTHMNIYQISKKTAITDLKKLQKLDLIKPEKKGRNTFYYATDKLKELTS